ncbi:MAG: ABC transporter ATP-binding protein [Vulcanimicrobiaceae bacterium]
MLRLRGAQKRCALVDVSFSVRAGECFGVLGPNGAGKTTLIKMISTLVVPDSGSLTVDGHDAVREAAQLRRRIGLCPSDERSFYGRLTGRENLRFFGALAGIPLRKLERKIADLAELLGIGDRLESRVQGYSTGMRQRLSLIRALLCDPALLILDEPTKALDPLAALEFRGFIRDRLMRETGTTVMLATNQLDEAWAMCDRIAILHNHTIAALGTPYELQHAVSDERSDPLQGYLHYVRGSTP